MLTGIGTVIADDPELTVRHVPCKRQPRRVVIDHRLEMPADAKILRGEPPILLTLSDDAARRSRLEALGVQVIRVHEDPAKAGKTDLAHVARELGTLGFNEVTVETGSRLNGSLLAAGVVDEIVLYVAPMIIGDTGQGLFMLPEIQSLEEARRPRIVDVRPVGDDWRITARFS